MAKTTDQIVLQKQQQISLRSEDWYNSFLQRAAKGEISVQEMNISKVDARMNNIEIREMNDSTVVMAFTKIIKDIFEYFNTDCSDTLVDMLITDIQQMWGRYSALELVRAITEGRRGCGDLYGRLSAKHINDWIAKYEDDLEDDLAAYHSGHKHELLSIEEVKEAYNKQAKKEEKKREYSHAEKIQSLQDMNISDEERKKREYSREWNLEEHGDYEKYMEKFKP